jgi:branched-chain amino acid transport system ATP-binding protein
MPEPTGDPLRRPTTVVEPVLRVRGLRKSFGRLAAVDGLDFDVAAGEVLGVAGPNGAGKSTVVNLLTKIPFGPDGGEVELRGVSIAGASPRSICLRGLSRTFQAESVFESLSVADNVRVAAAYGQPRRARRGHAERIGRSLEITGLAASAQQSAGSIPLIDKKRLMIASALATDPCVLMLDEPASGLTEDEQRDLAELIRRVNGEGVAIVVIEHVLPLLRAVANRLMILVSGRLLVEGSPDAVLADQRVVAAYIGGHVA